MNGRAAAALVPLLLAIGCSGGDPTVEAAPGTTGPAATSTSTSTATTGTTASPATTSTTAGPACPAPPAPEDGSIGGTLVGEPTPVAATIDGSGADDDVVATELGAGGWHVVVRLGDGGAIDELLPSAAADAVRVRSAVDLDADGTDELWVQVGTGAAATIVGLYDVDGCDLEPVLVDGTPAQFSIGGTVLLLQGLACGEADVTHLGATSDDGLTYATLDLTYELQAGELVRVGDETNTLAGDDPALAAYSEFAC